MSSAISITEAELALDLSRSPCNHAGVERLSFPDPSREVGGEDKIRILPYPFQCIWTIVFDYNWLSIFLAVQKSQNAPKIPPKKIPLQLHIYRMNKKYLQEWIRKRQYLKSWLHCWTSSAQTYQKWKRKQLVSHTYCNEETAKQYRNV